MFTGVAIAQLVERGKLSFDDTIGTYLSGFPPQIAEVVTIHQLLTQTTGMGDAALVRRPDAPEPPHTLAGLLARIVTEPLQFQPGSRFGYSNDGFIRKDTPRRSSRSETSMTWTHQDRRADRTGRSSQSQDRRAHEHTP